MIEIILQDNTTTLTLPVLNIPLQEDTIENAVDVQTLDYNIYTDFINQKRKWTHTWAYLSDSDYNLIKGFYDRQFTLFRYPTLTIGYYGVTDIPVRLNLNTKTIVNTCGMVNNVTLVMRETTQLEIS